MEYQRSNIIKPGDYKDSSEYIRSFARVVAGKPALPRSANANRDNNIRILDRPEERQSSTFQRHDILTDEMAAYCNANKWELQYIHAQILWEDDLASFFVSHTMRGFSIAGARRKQFLYCNSGWQNYEALLDSLDKQNMSILEFFITNIRSDIATKNFKTRK